MTAHAGAVVMVLRRRRCYCRGLNDADVAGAAAAAVEALVLHDFGGGVAERFGPDHDSTGSRPRAGEFRISERRVGDGNVVRVLKRVPLPGDVVAGPGYETRVFVPARLAWHIWHGIRYAGLSVVIISGTVDPGIV